MDWVNGMVLEIFQIFTIILITDWQIVYIVPFVFAIQVYYLRQTIPAWSNMNKLHRAVDIPTGNTMGETMDGLSTIKTFGRLEEFRVQLRSLRNQKQVLDMSHCGVWQWFYVRLTLLSNVIMAYACGVILYNRANFNPVMVILCFQNIDSLRHTLAGMLHSSGGMKEQMECMQRIFNIDDIPQEKQTSKIAADDVPKQFAQSGQITFEDVHLRYRPTTEKVLKGLSLEIKGGQKIGIVGRTGAGKSTFSLAMTRIVEAE